MQLLKKLNGTAVTMKYKLNIAHGNYMKRDGNNENKVARCIQEIQIERLELLRSATSNTMSLLKYLLLKCL